MTTGVSPVYGFLKQPSLSDFAGHLAAVFFMAGCNFRCGFCHNASLLAGTGPTLSWRRLDDAVRGFARDWVDGAVVTGGEPTLSPRLPELIRWFRSRGWAVKLDTNGSAPGVLRDCLPLVDYVAMDVKAGRSGYPALTGCPDVDRITESIDLVKSGARDYEFRTTVIETFHTNEQMREIADMIRPARRYVMQPFVPRDDLPDPAYARTRRTSPDRLAQLRDLMGDAAGTVAVRGEILSPATPP